MRGGVRVVDEALDAAARVSGRSLPSAGHEASRQAVEQAYLRYGDEALQALRNNGLGLIEAAGRHGDDVWRFAAESPEAARALATRADELMPMVRRIGPEVMKLEAKAPGLSRIVARELGDDAVVYFARNVPVAEAQRLVALAQRADSNATRKALLKAYKKHGSKLLDALPPAAVIGAGGLTVAMVVAAIKSPEVMIEEITKWGTIAGVALMAWLTAPFVIRLWVKMVGSLLAMRRKGEKQAIR